MKVVDLDDSNMSTPKVDGGTVAQAPSPERRRASTVVEAPALKQILAGVVGNVLEWFDFAGASRCLACPTDVGVKLGLVVCVRESSWPSTVLFSVSSFDSTRATVNICNHCHADASVGYVAPPHSPPDSTRVEAPVTCT